MTELIEFGGSPPAGSPSLASLSDVNAPSPSDTNLLTFDLGTAKWIPITRTNLAADAAFAVRSATLAEAHADTGSASSVAEQTLASLAIPAGRVAAGDRLRFTAYGTFLNNSGASVNYTWKFKIGATTLLATAALSQGPNASRGKWRVTADIAIESTTAQRVSALLAVSTQTTDSWSPYTGTFSAVGSGTSAEDTSTSKNVVLTCQLGTSASTVDVICRASDLSLVTSSSSAGGGSGVWTVVSKTTTYTANDGEIVLASAAGAAFTVTLPAVGSGKRVRVKKTDSSANPVTISPASGTIDGAATRTLNTQYEAVEVVSDGTNWFVT